MVKKIILAIVLIGSFVLVVHNASTYPYNAGYDAGLHLKYADIISQDWRIPTFAETRENYNPPLFYLVSGLVGRSFGYQVWQYVNVLLALVSLWLWYLVFGKLHPKDKIIPLVSVALVFSWPVFHKTIVMFSLETFFMFTTALGFWYFVTHFQGKTSLKKAIVLALIVVINLLTRMPGIILALTITAGMIGLGIKSKIAWGKISKFLAVFWLLLIVFTSWFYLGRNSEEVYGVGEGGEVDKPFFQRQPLSFYFDIPFKFMMTYPMRQNLPLNKMIPIYYSEFWGDFWNYYPQPRFGLSISEVRKNRELSNEPRIKSLVLQNQVNLLPTLLMVAGFVYLLLKNLNKKFVLPEAMMVAFAILTWLGFLSLLTKYPSWKSDSVKASYMLYALPIFGYATSLLVFQFLKKYRLLFIPSVVMLVLAAIVNLTWSWF